MINWSDERIDHAKLVKPQADPLLIQLSFTQPIPKTVQHKPVEKKVVKQIPKPKTKPKKSPRKKTVKAKKPPQKKTPVKETETTQADTVEKIAQPTPPKTQPIAELLEIYLADILSSIEQKKRYPSLARRKNIEGKVSVRFKLSCDGDITDLKIQGAHGLLRKAANKAIKAAQPFPKIPQALKCPLPVTYAMAYSLKQ
ncbi:MAG: TonB family protein [Candidatus Thiodiazotropha lotti]|nr:TonB family protein [Candidatus Thiodiazotropha lotti]